MSILSYSRVSLAGRTLVTLLVASAVALAATLLLASSAFAVSGSDTITTFAGPNVAGNPFGIGVDNLAVDAAGDVYVSDRIGNVVRKVDPRGTITTVAGGNGAGSSGDDGPATAAQLNTPRGLAVDTTGNLYIADSDNDRVRKVDAAGVITTVAGIGGGGHFSGDNGLAIAAQLSRPDAVAVDTTGNLYIADAGNSRVRKVDAAGVITTFAGDSERRPRPARDGGPATAELISDPVALALDAAGNVYIADAQNHLVRKVDPTTGVITTVAGFDGDVFSGLAVDAAGNIYIAEGLQGDRANRVNKVDPAGVETTVAGTGTRGFAGDNGPAAAALFDSPADVAFDASGTKLYIADANNNRVRVVTEQLPTATVDRQAQEQKLIQKLLQGITSITPATQNAQKTTNGALCARIDCNRLSGASLAPASAAAKRPPQTLRATRLPSTAAGAATAKARPQTLRAPASL